jgi:hypothetical protein
VPETLPPPDPAEDLTLDPAEIQRLQLQAEFPEFSTVDPSITREDANHEDLVNSLKLQFVDVSHGVDTNAQDYAARQNNIEANEGGNVFSRFKNKMWHGYLKKNYDLVTHKADARQQIIDSGNLYAMHDGDEHDHQEATAAVVNRFVDGYIHSENTTGGGETQREFGDLERGAEMTASLKDIVARYARGEIDEETVTEEKTRLMDTYGQAVRAEDRKKGLLFADNVLEVAINARAAHAHGVGLDRIDAALSAKMGEAQLGARTDARFNAVEKIVDKVYSTRVGSLVNETTLNVAAATVVTALTLTKSKLVAAATLVSGGVLAGGMAAAREAYHLKQDRRTHAREMAEGGVGDGDSLIHSGKRREQLEATRYQTKTAAELTQGLESARDSLNASPDVPGLRSALQAVVEARSRITMSDAEKIDLISYSDKTRTEVERASLDRRLAEARVALGRAARGMSDDDLRSAGFVTKDAAGVDQVNRDVSAVLGARTYDVQTSINEDNSERDSAFRKLQLKRAAMMGATAFFVGSAVGAAVQEGVAMVENFDGTSELQGAFEGRGLETQRETLLHTSGTEHLKDTLGKWIQHGKEAFTGSAANTSTMAPDGSPASQLNMEMLSSNAPDLGKHVEVSVPDGYHLVKSEGEWQMVDVKGNAVVDHIKLEGTVSERAHELHDQLEAKGFSAHVSKEAVDSNGDVVKSGAKLSAKDLVHRYPDKFDHIHRQLWYDKDTPSVFERSNERSLQWGGQGGSGMDSKGNYVLDVSNFTDKSSFHGDQYAHAQELIKQGKLQLAVSMSKGTQAHPLMISFDKDGRAIIPKGSIGSQLFSMEDGHAKFRGGYLEAVELRGDTNSHGIQDVRVLATASGDNSVHRLEIPTNNEYKVVIASPEPESSVPRPFAAPLEELPTQVPWTVPVLARSGLTYAERVNDDEGDDGESNDSRSPFERVYGDREGYYGSYYGSVLQERREQWRKERSPRLEADPQADLNTGEELAWYREQQRERRGDDYIDEIDANVESDDILLNIGDEVKAISCIPVAAASESERIFDTLSLYAQQDPDAVEASVVLLNVNWKESQEGDPDMMAKIQKTQAEIERARIAFPNLRIASFTKVWTEDFLASRTDENGKVLMYGEVIKTLYDTAAFALDNSIKEGRRNSATEAILVTNDADALGMNAHYMRNWVEVADNDPTVDVMAGSIRWGTDSYEDYPGYGMAAGIYAVFNMATQNAGVKDALSTTGPNSGFRFSAYAATGGCEDHNRMGAGADAILGQRLVDARRQPSPLGTDPSAEPRKVLKHMVGTDLDTAPDRLLGAYRQGQWIASGWQGFDSGGYEDRSVSASLGTLEKEDPLNDIEGISTRVKTSIEGFVNNWYRDPVIASSALAMYFGTKDEGGRPIFETSWEGESGWGGDGRFNFNFTPAGKQWLQRRLLNDSHGTRDPYGERVRRQLYEERGESIRAARTALRSPRFVSHTPAP